MAKAEKRPRPPPAPRGHALSQQQCRYLRASGLDTQAAVPARGYVGKKTRPSEVSGQPPACTTTARSLHQIDPVLQHPCPRTTVWRPRGSHAAPGLGRSGRAPASVQMRTLSAWTRFINGEAYFTLRDIKIGFRAPLRATMCTASCRSMASASPCQLLRGDYYIS
jgi:hypothetical protein